MPKPLTIRTLTLSGEILKLIYDPASGNMGIANLKLTPAQLKELRPVLRAMTANLETLSKVLRMNQGTLQNNGLMNTICQHVHNALLQQRKILKPILDAQTVKPADIQALRQSVNAVAQTSGQFFRNVAKNSGQSNVLRQAIYETAQIARSTNLNTRQALHITSRQAAQFRHINRGGNFIVRSGRAIYNGGKNTVRFVGNAFRSSPKQTIGTVMATGGMYASRIGMVMMPIVTNPLFVFGILFLAACAIGYLIYQDYQHKQLGYNGNNDVFGLGSYHQSTHRGFYGQMFNITTQNTHGLMHTLEIESDYFLSRAIYRDYDHVGHPPIVFLDTEINDFIGNNQLSQDTIMIINAMEDMNNIIHSDPLIDNASNVPMDVFTGDLPIDYAVNYSGFEITKPENINHQNKPKSDDQLRAIVSKFNFKKGFMPGTGLYLKSTSDGTIITDNFAESLSSKNSRHLTTR